MTDFATGDRVVDDDQHEHQRSAARVVDLPNTTADDFPIDGTGKTVAEFNPDHPATAPVVGVQFERADGEPTGRTYHYPATRLEPISEDWEPTEEASKGQRERAAVIEDHREAVETFAEGAQRLLEDPQDEGEWIAAITDDILDDMATRGQCRYTRDDSYRPDDDEALVCWQCSQQPRNRPEKYASDDPAGPHCERRTDDRTAAKALAAWITKGRTTEPLPTAGEEYAGWSFRSDVDSLRNYRNDRSVRLAAIRLAYESTLSGVEQYNYSRAIALLRDIGAAAAMPIIGEGNDRPTEDGNAGRVL